MVQCVSGGQGIPIFLDFFMTFHMVSYYSCSEMWNTNRINRLRDGCKTAMTEKAVSSVRKFSGWPDTSDVPRFLQLMLFGNLFNIW